MSDTLSHNRCQ